MPRAARTPSGRARGGGSRQATLDDVARRAGVHVSTVSRVLTGSEQLSIRPETRTRIERAAQELRYRPNALARALRLATTGALGLLVPSLRNPIYAEIIRGAFERAWERGFVVVLAEDAQGSDAELAYERLVEQGRIDGLLVASTRPDSLLLERTEEERVPCVFVNRRHLDGGHNVSMREEDAGALAAEHLLGLGHTRLGHLAGPDELDTARRRVVGFTRAASGARVVHAEFDERAGYAAMRELLDVPERPTAVFVSNINQAVGALAGARASGVKIPADVSLVTYDDDAVAEYLDPPLTTIHMPMHELGVAAVDAILARIDGDAPADVTIPTPPRLVVRRSTGPPPGMREERSR